MSILRPHSTSTVTDQRSILRLFTECLRFSKGFSNLHNNSQLTPVVRRQLAKPGSCCPRRIARWKHFQLTDFARRGRPCRSADSVGPARQAGLSASAEPRPDGVEMLTAQSRILDRNRCFECLFSWRFLYAGEVFLIDKLRTSRSAAPKCYSPS
ncbi:MAG: hypothetical protein JWM11_3803 [Planctomycetaceae bacterium]|nr:hypothetical protein [Planctomycetaceae bacterium]